MNTKITYRLEIAETGDILADGMTKEEALSYLAQQEAEDIKNGNYTDNYYSIRAIDNANDNDWII